MNLLCRSRLRSCSMLICSLIAALDLTACACNVPVFRYALERWPTEPHVVSLSANVPLDIASIKVSPHANVVLQRNSTPQDKDVRVTYVNSQAVWYEGPWESNLVPRLSDSPLRRRVAHELLTGTSASWILLEGDNAATNAAIASIVKETLDRFASDTTLPPRETESSDATELEENKLYASIPLKISFTLHSLSRTDPHETFFVRQLLGAYAATISSNTPLLVVIFGQGRMIHAPSDMIEPVFITDLCRFLCGDCSCQIKEMNPGLDLVMTANWNGATQKYPEQAPTLLPDGSSFVIGGTGTLAESVFSPPGSSPVVESKKTTPQKTTAQSIGQGGRLKLAIYSTIVLLGIVLIGVLLKSKKN